MLLDALSKLARKPSPSECIHTHAKQSGQITGSGMCTASDTVLPDLVIFSFVLLFIVFGDLIKFLEINSFSNIYQTCYDVQFKCEF